MRRGDVWTVAGGGDYTGKPRPVVIVQDDRFESTDSVTVCPFTTDLVAAPLFRVEITPSDLNRLSEPSRLMADKIATVRRGRLREHIGRLDDEDMVRLNRAILVFLGFAGSSRSSTS